ncbi:unnamed protein product [Victoria cruziana]
MLLLMELTNYDLATLSTEERSVMQFPAGQGSPLIEHSSVCSGRLSRWFSTCFAARLRTAPVHFNRKSWIACIDNCRTM